MNKTIWIYDRITNTPVEVEVSDEVYKQYMRTGWNIKDNDESFFDHEIQFSALKGNINGSIENFHEFISNTSSVELEAEYRRLYECIKKLSKLEQKVIKMIYFEGYTEAECAYMLCTNQSKIHRTKRKGLYRLNKLLKKL